MWRKTQQVSPTRPQDRKLRHLLSRWLLSDAWLARTTRTKSVGLSLSKASIHCRATATRRTCTRCLVLDEPSLVVSAAHSELRKGLISGTIPAVKERAPARDCRFFRLTIVLPKKTLTFPWSSLILSAGMVTNAAFNSMLTCSEDPIQRTQSPASVFSSFTGNPVMAAHNMVTPKCLTWLGSFLSKTSIGSSTYVWIRTDGLMAVADLVNQLAYLPHKAGELTDPKTHRR